jgi:hypothetical protein
MKHRYLEVTFRKGVALAAYLYLPRPDGARVTRTVDEGSGIKVDYDEADVPLGVEVTAPAGLGLADLNVVLQRLGQPALDHGEWAPARAARSCCSMPGVRSLASPALATDVGVTAESLNVSLSDGRTHSVPLVRSPRLLAATPEEGAHWELLGDGEGIHWPDVDEDLGVAGLLAGQRSVSTPESRPAEPGDELSAFSVVKAFGSFAMSQPHGARPPRTKTLTTENTENSLRSEPTRQSVRRSGRVRRKVERQGAGFPGRHPRKRGPTCPLRISVRVRNSDDFEAVDAGEVVRIDGVEREHGGQ